MVGFAVDVVEILAQPRNQTPNLFGSPRHSKILIGMRRHRLGQAVAGISETIDSVARLTLGRHAVSSTANRFR
ncbi:MAG: hypothetical protein JO259_04435 [Mycobacterium sp.]|nr:hypothetical protein [Mycobacterium sp.]